jgi:hypothetical protein
VNAAIVPPPRHENRRCLACDTDALIQILISNLLQPLRELKQHYSIQPIITPEVEIELRSLSKNAKRIDAPLTKALKNRVVRILSHDVLREIYGTTADAFYPAIQSLGARYRIAGRGKRTHTLLPSLCKYPYRGMINLLYAF